MQREQRLLATRMRALLSLSLFTRLHPLLFEAYTRDFFTLSSLFLTLKSPLPPLQWTRDAAAAAATALADNIRCTLARK